MPPLIMDPLFVDAGLDQTVLYGTEVTLTGSSNGLDYTWAPASELSDPFSISTLTTANETTTFYLTASNANCTVVDQVTVFVSDVLTIPGSFSPNGDGVNDTWIIPGISFYPNTRITLFDRWGQMVTDIVGYNDLKPWDGTKNGKLVSDGVYFYVIDLKSESSSKPLKGSVTLIR